MNSDFSEMGRCLMATDRSLPRSEGISRLPFTRFGSFTAVLFALLLLQAMESDVQGREIVVEPGTKLSAVFSTLVPGDEVILKEGYHRGGAEVKAIHGTREQPIVIRSENPDRPAVIIGGQENLKISSVSWIVLDGLHFADSKDNGLHIDDVTSKGGVKRSHHIVLKNLVIRHSGYEFNSDGMKISGCDDLLIENCKVTRWARDGCAIDMLRCQRVLIDNCTFDGGSWGLVGLQVKGGCSDISFTRCLIKGVLHRGIQIGGSTSLESVWPATVDYEAARIEVRDCQIDGGEASLSVVNAKTIRIQECRFIRPTRWFFRLLPESQIENVTQSLDIEVRGNCFLIRRSMVGVMNTKIPVSTGTIRFIDNSWYCRESPRRTVRSEVAPFEVGGTHGIDPVKRIFQGRVLDYRTNLEMQKLEAIRKAESQSVLRRSLAWLIGGGAVLIFAWFLTRPLAIRGWREATAIRARWIRLNMAPYALLAAILAFYAGIPLVEGKGTGIGLPRALAEFQSGMWYPEQDETAKWLFTVWFAFLAVLSIGLLVPRNASTFRHAVSLLIPATLLILGVLIIDLVCAGFWDSSKLPEKSHLHAVFWGSIWGLLLHWGCSGIRPRNVDSVERFDRGSSPLDLACALMVFHLVYERAMPFDFSTSFRDTFYKLESQVIALAPDFRFTGDIVDKLSQNGPMVFLGMACSIALTAGAAKVRPIRSAVSLLLLCILQLEATQLMLPTGGFSSADAIIDFLFGLVGIGLAHSLIASHPWLSARPDGSLLGSRMRWALRLTFLGIAFWLPALLSADG
jgi:hypothetical protein